MNSIVKLYGKVKYLLGLSIIGLIVMNRSFGLGLTHWDLAYIVGVHVVSLGLDAWEGVASTRTPKGG